VLSLLVMVLTDILGPPGSGVEWLRYIIEQLTGLKTGSTVVAHPEIFTGEGHTTKVFEHVFLENCFCNNQSNVKSSNVSVITCCKIFMYLSFVLYCCGVYTETESVVLWSNYPV